MALGNQGDPEALTELTGLLDSSSAKEKKLATSAIGELKNQQFHQKEGKKAVSIYPDDKKRLDAAP